MEGLQFLAFPQVEPLANVDKGRHGGVAGPERPGNDRADVGRGDRLRGRVARVPLVLMARMLNETEIARSIGADQRGAVHHAGDVLQAGGELDTVHHRVDLREGAQYRPGFEARRKRSIALRIEGLGVQRTRKARRQCG